MTFAEAVQSVFRNYANFNGRARRSEFWYFTLLNFLINMLSVTPLVPLVALYALAVLVPTLAAGSRRLHDTGRSGLWLLLMLAPVVGEIILIVWFCEDSKPGANQYGPCPKYGGPYVQKQSSYVAPIDNGCLVYCVSGPIKGQTYHLPSGGQFMFGRAHDCAVRLPDGTPGVSSRHCILRYEKGTLILEDLHSSYGTFLDSGKRLPPNYPEHIGLNTRFFLGGPDVVFGIFPCT